MLHGLAGYLYGRGSSDDKGPILAMIAAVRQFLQSGQVWASSLFLAPAAAFCFILGSQPPIRRLVFESATNLLLFFYCYTF